jgi:hypothetical protein
MDIDYLRKVSAKRSKTIFVDTSRRDKSAFPTPSEFQVDLESAIPYVVDMKVLDATIPNIEYLIDEGRDTFYYAYRPGGSTARPRSDVWESLSRVADAPPVLSVLRATGEGFVARVGVTALEGAPLPESVPSVPVAYSAERSPSAGPPRSCFHAVHSDCPLARVLSSSPPDGVVPWDAASTPLPPPLSTDPATGTLYVQSQSGAVYSIAAGDAPLAVPPADYGGAATVHRVFRPVGVEPHASVTTVVAFSVSDPASVQAHHVFDFHLNVLDHGDFDVAALVKVLEESMPRESESSRARRIRFDDNSTVYPRSTPFFMKYNQDVVLGSGAPFAVVARPDLECCEVYGFSLTGGDPQSQGSAGSGAPARPPGSSRVPVASDPDVTVFASVPAVSAGDLAGAMSGPAGALPERLASPGILNRMGQRFVILRIPEIEHHQPALASSATSAGVGLFKLYDQIVSHLRFDFLSTSDRGFHPIGRLSKFRIRFETLSGRLYNFKGVDFHMLLSIDYLEPNNESMAPAPPLSSLNPDYVPDDRLYEVTRTRVARPYTDELGGRPPASADLRRGAVLVSSVDEGESSHPTRGASAGGGDYGYDARYSSGGASSWTSSGYSTDD